MKLALSALSVVVAASAASASLAVKQHPALLSNNLPLPAYMTSYAETMLAANGGSDDGNDNADAEEGNDNAEAEEGNGRKRQLSAETDLDEWLISLAKCAPMKSSDGSKSYYVSFICGYSLFQGAYGPEIGVFADSHCKEYKDDIDFYDLAAANGVSVDQDHISAYLAKAFKMGIDCSKEENASACSKLMYNTADFDTCEAVVGEDA
eukprot:CAMPEP_0178682632 /NCGR_PEP_ID=MMETSP0699-20121125/1875_1 /TAXON_ID=265572 /ORGANISM="Extubocellulus spinifer, Strain CCMP396" /LENGTH=206 /DNA_ID=CAMNT_0020327175 /DNA_START=185 /DNA_END=802 /DNA_ORIENTATION=-